MKYYENLDIRKVGNDLFLVATEDGKYVVDNVCASFARLNDGIDINNDDHVAAIVAQVPAEREKKRVFSPQEYLEKGKLCRLMIYLNTGCNMRCIYCHCNSTVGDNMPDELIYTSIDKYYEHICSRIESIRYYEEVPQITFMGGGEPFLRIDKIKEIVTYFNKMCKELQLIPRYVLVTNTSLGSDGDWRWLVENDFMINLSLDGTERIQNRNRPLAGGKKSYPYIESRLKFLSNIGASVHVRSTVIVPKEVPEICEFFKQFDCVKTHALEPVSLAGRALESHLDVNVNSFYKDFFRAYSTYLFKEPERFKSSWFKPFKRTEGFCGAVYCNAIVMPDGTISLCSELDSKEPREELRSIFLVGNVNDNGSVFESAAAVKFSHDNQVDALPYCHDCIIKYKCGGGCYIKRYRDFYENSIGFYNTFCKSAISMNISFLIGCMNEQGQ